MNSVPEGSFNNPCFSGCYSDCPTNPYFRASEIRRTYYDDLYPNYEIDDFCCTNRYRESELPERVEGCDASVNWQGVMCLRLSNAIKIHMTVDGAIRIQNLKFKTTLVLDKSDKSSAFVHPQGIIYHRGSRVEVKVHHPNGYKFAKMWSKGISFKSEGCPVTYLVDEAGTRTTTNCFNDISSGIALGVFYSDLELAEDSIPRAITMLREAQYWEMNDCTKCWVINNIKILQKQDGFVRVQRTNYNTKIRTSPTNGSAAIISPYIHCTASLGINNHMFIRKDSKRIHFDGNDFIVRNFGQSAGFNISNLLQLY